MKGHTKAIVALLGLIGSCLVCAWLWPYASYYLLVSRISQGSQGRIHCWVKVVDQNGKGVSGYKCEITEHWAPLLPFMRSGPTLITYESRVDGTIEYDSKRPVGEVYFGYQPTQWKLNPKNLLGQDLRVDALHLARERKQNPEHYMGSKENPYMLHVYSVGKPQKLLYWSKQVRLKEEHDWACIDILAGKVWESNSPEGDVAIRDNKLTQENIKGYCTQSFIAGNNWSIIPKVDDWGLQPPKEGYKKELCCAKDWLALRNRSGLGTAIYYRLSLSPNGQYIYGRLVLAGSGRASDSLFRSFTNLQGKRNLYFIGYEKSVMHPSAWQMRNYVSPPVKLEDLAAAQEKGK